MSKGKVVVKGKTKTKVKKSPVKAGSTHKEHGGLPTQKVILITSKIKVDKAKQTK